MPDGSLIESDEALIERVRSGNDRAIEELLGRYRHFARAKARAYFLAGADREDIVQEGMIGLFKAIRDFEVARNTSFKAFAELCVTRQIITAIKSATRQKHMPLNSYVSLNRTAAGDGDDERQLADELFDAGHDPADLVISAEEIGEIRATVNRVLSELETEVLRLYIEGKSYQEIASTLGRHVKSIDNALQRIKRKIEHYLVAREALP